VNSRRFMDRPSGNGLMLHPQVHSQSARFICAEQTESSFGICQIAGLLLQICPS
jgi:hypothetical protein